MIATASRHRRLKLVVGAPEPGPGGIQDAFIDEVKRLKREDPLAPLTVLVGSNFLRLHLSRTLAVRLGGHANITFLLLRDLARALGAGPLAARGRRRIPEHGRDLILGEAIAALAQGGSYFREILAREGFVEALGATLSDLKEARIDPVTLRAAAAARSRKGAASEASKLSDLADLYEAYDDLLRDRRLYDEEDLMRSAAEEAASTGLAWREGAREAGPAAVLVYGFYDATWNQRLLIRDVLAFKEGTVFFPMEAPDPERSWDYARPLLDWLSSWIPERRDLAAGGPAPRRATRATEVRFLSAPGETREVVEAIRWLVSQARERSVPFGEMALLYRTAEPYRALAAEVMRMAGGVPGFLADGRPLAGTPAGRALILLMSAREEGLSRRSVIDLLALTAPDGEASRWDRISREAGVVGGIADWRRRLERFRAGQRGGGREGSPAAELSRHVEALHAALQAVPAEGTWVGLAQAWAGMLERFAPDHPSREAVASCLTGLGALDDVSSPVFLARFTATLRQALDRPVFRTEEDGAFQRSGIFVGSVMESRLLSFHAAAVIGLVEKSFPAPARQDPILLDDERTEINALVGEARLALKSRRLDEERLLFRLARAAASASLLVTYPRIDAATARPRIPSPFLLRLARALEGRHIDYETLESLERTDRVALAALAPTGGREILFPREFLLRALEGASAPDADLALRRRAAAYLRANPILLRALGAEAARWGETRFTAHDGVVLRPSVLESLRALTSRPEEPISATRIEEYARCPLAYFMKHVLRLRPLDEPEELERIDSLRRGALVHAILFHLYADLRDRGLLPLRPERLGEAESALDRACTRLFARAEEEGATGFRLLWELDKEQMRADLAGLLRLEAESGDVEGWSPLHLELRYGMEADRRGDPEGEDPASTSRPVLVEVAPGRAVRLKGRIDRVEISRDGRKARVVDYKTGRMDRYAPDQLRGGTTVQLPLYMLAAARLLASRNPAPVVTEAIYLSVEGRSRYKSVSFGAETLERRIEDVRGVVSTFSGGVERGVFPAYPGPDQCRHCDYRLACGEGREARFARKRGDAIAADYLRMREGLA